MKKVRPHIWLLILATAIALSITAQNHIKGRINIRAFSWMNETSLSLRDKPEYSNKVFTGEERLKQEERQPLVKMDSQLKEEGFKQQEQQPMVKEANGPGIVQAIFVSKGESSMMFDEKFYKEGSIVNGFKVLKIYRDKVEFEKNGKIWVQEL